jgi:TRAP-type mannitol/chloroaromatic compound transport system permease small subunit
MSAPPGAASARAPGLLPPVVRAIDAVSTAAGWLAAALIAPLTLAVAYEVAARYLFNAPTRWVFHVTYTLYGAQFMLAAAYTLLQGGHIRTDVFYGRWSPRTRAIIDAIAYVVFFFPGMLLVLRAGLVEAHHAWLIGERAGGWPVYPFKAIIPLTALLLLLQGLAELLRCARALRRAAA